MIPPSTSWTIPAAARGGGGGGGGGGAGGGGGGDCDEVPDPDPISGPDCVTDTLTCGASVTGNTVGGENNFTKSEYQSWFCVVAYEQYNGKERIYEFDHPGTGNVTFTLDAPCGGLELFAMFWEDSTCPGGEVSIQECEWSESAITIWNNEPRRYLVVVEEQEGFSDMPYTLSIACP